MNSDLPSQAPESRIYRFSTGILAFLAVALVSITASAYTSDSGRPPTRSTTLREVHTASVFTPASRIQHFASLEVAAKAAIIVDETDGVVLYEKNADVQLPLASLTKVPLVLAVADVLPVDAQIRLPRSITPSSVGDSLAEGTQWTIRELIDYTLVSSSNEGAEVLAQIADEPMRVTDRGAPQGGAILNHMNELARELGLERTFFVNVSGLDDSTTLSGAYGSARDMAVLMTYAAGSRADLFSKTQQNEVVITGRDATARITNTNDAIPAISGLVMGKTGFTDLAGGNLAVVFDVSGHRITAVVLGSTREGRFSDMALLASTTRAALVH